MTHGQPTNNSDSNVNSNAQWMRRHKAVLSLTSLRNHDPRFGQVFVKGLGTRLWDADGRETIDLTSGYSVTNFGHCYPPFIAAALTQLQQLTHLTGDPHPGRVELAERLVQSLQQPPNTKVHFNSTGARAVESACKAAYAHRPGQILSIAPSFHGVSLATASLSDRAFSELRLPKELLHAFGHSSFPYCGQCPVQKTFPACDLVCASELFAYLTTSPSKISAIVVEPALGSRGYIFPPTEFFLRLRHLTREMGILLIADEVQTALGRCGTWLLSTAQGWDADLIVVGKSLGGGIAPISAVLGRAELLDGMPEGSDSETFAATPLACAVALSVLTELEQGPWMAEGSKVGERLRDGVRRALRQLPTTLPLHVEGRGASCAIEFGSQRASDPNIREAARSLASKFAATACRKGLLVHCTGPFSTRVVMLPNLNMADHELKDALARLHATLDALASDLTAQSD